MAVAIRVEALARAASRRPPAERLRVACCVSVHLRAARGRGLPRDARCDAAAPRRLAAPSPHAYAAASVAAARGAPAPAPRGAKAAPTKLYSAPPDS